MSTFNLKVLARRRLLAGASILLLSAGSAAVAQEKQAGFLFLKKSGGDNAACPPCCPPPASSPCAPLLTQPSLPSTEPGKSPDGTPGQSQPGTSPDGAAQSPNVNLGSEAAGASSGDTYFVAAPNMIGDLLYSSRTVRYSFLRLDGQTNFFSQASTQVVNSSVAENNSPIPTDRLYLRYNYFRNGQAVTGASPFRVPLDPGPNPVVFNALPETKKYDVNLITFGGEKTFFGGLMSLELRLPVVTTLSPRNTMNPGEIIGFNGDRDINGNPTFDVRLNTQNTLGSTDTTFGNMSMYLKALLWGDKANGLYVSAGTGVGLPTAPDNLLRFIDYASTSERLDSSSYRLREVRIENDTVALSPFLAALYMPNDRLFTQGFFSVEVPLNFSPIRYSNVEVLGAVFGSGGETPPPGSRQPPFIAHDHIREQTLIHLDWGTGYWVYREPTNRWITGIAPMFEVHYTGALADADQVQLPGDASAQVFDPNTGELMFEPGPIVGGIHKRLNIVNVTAGSTFLIGQRTTLATAFAVPVTSGFNRTFDWEAQVQLNYYFGGPATRPPQIPPPF